MAGAGSTESLGKGGMIEVRLGFAGFGQISNTRGFSGLSYRLCTLSAASCKTCSNLSRNFAFLWALVRTLSDLFFPKKDLNLPVA